MKKKEKVFFILKNICKFNVSMILMYIIGIAIMGLAPVIQLKVLENIIGVITRIIQEGINEYYIRQGILLIVIEGFVFILINMIDNISELVNNSLVLKIQHNTKTVIAKKMVDLDLAFFDDPDLLDIYENCVKQVDVSITEMVNLVTAISTMFVGFCGYVSIIFGVNKLAMLIILVTTLPMLIMKIHYKKRYYFFVIENTKSNRKKDYYYDVLTQKEFFKEQKLYNTTGFFLKKREDEFQKYYNKNRKLYVRGCIESFFANLIGRSGAIICIIWFFYDCICGKFNIASFTSVFYAIISIQDSLEAGFNILSISYESFLYFNVFFEFIEYGTKENDEIEVFKHEDDLLIEFSHVSFKYTGSEKYVLDDLNFKINGRGLFVIVGENGSGKSTIMKLLLRLYKPQRGKILINNIDINNYKQSDIVKIISPMFQDYNRYALSFKDNIIVGNLDNVKFFEKTMCKQDFADANKIADTLPQKYDTQLTKLFDKDGVELSIGQWQRVAIARSIYNDTPLFVWDEPIASVDCVSQNEIMEMINKKRNEKTFIIISHNFDVAKIADEILFIAEGKVSATGTHQELMNECEDYASMYTKLLDN